MTSIWSHFILSRPYSIIDLFLVFYLSFAAATGSIALTVKDTVFFSAVLLLWFFLTLVLEAKHKHDYRPRVSFWVPIACLAGAIVIGFTRNPYTVAFAIACIISTYFYIRKDEGGIFGAMSFISRGLYQASLFLFSYSLFSTNYQNTTALIAFAIFAGTAARNLIGDLRDVMFDLGTFSVKMGEETSYVVVAALTLLASAAFYTATNEPLVSAPLVVFAITSLFYGNGYAMHRAAIAMTAATSVLAMLALTDNKQAMLALTDNKQAMPMVLLLFISSMSTELFYHLIPRKSNPKETINTRMGFFLTRPATTPPTFNAAIKEKRK